MTFSEKGQFSIEEIPIEHAATSKNSCDQFSRRKLLPRESWPLATYCHTIFTLYWLFVYFIVLKLELKFSRRYFVSTGNSFTHSWFYYFMSDFSDYPLQTISPCPPPLALNYLCIVTRWSPGWQRKTLEKCNVACSPFFALFIKALFSVYDLARTGKTKSVFLCDV